MNRPRWSISRGWRSKPSNCSSRADTASSQIDDSERDTLACNVLALGGKRLLAIEENQKTNDRLRRAGFDVRTFPGSELCINGSGGPTCLTRPLLRG